MPLVNDKERNVEPDNVNAESLTSAIWLQKWWHTFGGTSEIWPIQKGDSWTVKKINKNLKYFPFSSTRYRRKCIFWGGRTSFGAKLPSMWWEFCTAPIQLQTSYKQYGTRRGLKEEINAEKDINKKRLTAMQSQKKEKKDKKSHQNDKWNHSQRLSNWICGPLRMTAYVNENILSQCPNWKNMIRQSSLSAFHCMVKKQFSVSHVLVLLKWSILCHLVRFVSNCPDSSLPEQVNKLFIHKLVQQLVNFTRRLMIQIRTRLKDDCGRT